MSVSLLDHHKESTAKCRASIDKENAIIRNNKSSGGVKKKGLLLNSENRVSRTTVPNFFVSEAKFPIYFDDNDENDRSRPRMRKNVCRKEIRAKQNDQDLEKTLSSTKIVEINTSQLHSVSRRALSSSRLENLLNKTVNTHTKLFHNRRAHSENRKVLLQNANCVVQSSGNQKIKHLTNDVKKRTFSSIETWKNKMRKPCTISNTNSTNLLSVDKKHTKTRKNSVVESKNLKLEVAQNQAVNLNENVEKSVSKVDSLTNVLQFLSNIAVILEDKPNVKADSTSNLQDDKLTSDKSNIITPLDGLSSLPLTPAKVRYEKNMTARKLLKQENDFDNICETNYVFDYLEDVLDTERKKEDNAPKLSSRFLRENVNAEQRKIIVGYLVRLGVHCNYSSNVVYQAVKLFNVAIDRILMKTNDIQLVALSCLWIILKREAPYSKIPSATALLQLAKDLYINQEKYLLMYEKKIFLAVKFNTRFADPFSLLSYYVLNANQDDKCNIIKLKDISLIYFCGCYMIDLSMLDESLCDIPAYVIATAAVELSLRFVYSDYIIDQKWYSVWRNKQSLTEWEERMMKLTMQLMIQHVLDYNDFSSKVIYKKYTYSRHNKVTYFLHEKLQTMIKDAKKSFNF